MASRPNILNIAIDDLTDLDTVIRAVMPSVDLPNLRALMNSGTNFKRAYCAVTVCQPSRVAALMGMSPGETGAFDLSRDQWEIIPPEATWSAILHRAGYFCGTYGKMWHGYGAPPAQVYAALYDTAPFKYPYNPKGTPTEWGGGADGYGWDDETEWYDVQMTNDAIAFIQGRPVGSPWYLEAGYRAPHSPFIAPNRIFRSLDPSKIVLPTAPNGTIVPFVARFVKEANTPVDPALWSADEQNYYRLTVRNYIAGALWMDENLGRLLNSLAASPHADSTIIACWSDNGLHLGDHGINYVKFTEFEPSARVPFIIKVPGQQPRTITDPVSLIDLGHTLLDYAGLPWPPERRSTSLRPYVEGSSIASRPIPTFWYGATSMAIKWTDGVVYRCTVYSELAEFSGDELFDLDADPWCKFNLATTHPDFIAIRNLLIEAAYDWHMLIVEQGVDVSRPSPMASYLGTVPTDARIATSFIALGDVAPMGRSPGWQRMWSSPAVEGGTVRMPPHIEGFSTIGRKGAGLVLIANAYDNVVSSEDAYWQKMHVTLGAGNDTLLENEAKIHVIAYGGPGNDWMIGGGIKGSQLYGGPGQDTLTAKAQSLLDGGSGNDLLIGSADADTLIAGPGDDTLLAGAGDDTLILDGGSNTVTLGNGLDTVIVRRTGLTQTITDLKPGNILDLSDWSGIGPVTVVAVGATVEVRAGLERIICAGGTVATVKAAITGAPVAA